MDKQLREKTQEWMQLERKTLEQRKQAEEFYESNLMELIVQEYVSKFQKEIDNQAEYMVISVGTSYEPIVLNIKLFQPKKVLFLYTEKTAVVLSKIVACCGMESDSYEKHCVNESNPPEIYREIKRSYLEWGKPEKMVIDFTGGTKAMSVAAAMAGAMINVQLVYVGSDDYLVDFRKPNPGSEKLCFIDNPLEVFGDLEVEKAMILFEEHNYARAREKLAELKESIPDTNARQELGFAYLLAKAYEAWDMLDFMSAYDHMKQLVYQLGRDRIMYPEFLMMDCYEALKSQEQILWNLQQIPQMLKDNKFTEVLQDKKMIAALMFSIRQNGLIREKQEKYDMATLLFYRLLEMIGQKRLSDYGLNVSDADYLKLVYNTEQRPEFAGKTAQERYDKLFEKVKLLNKKLYKHPKQESLPEKIALMDGFVILHVLGDPLVYDGNPKNISVIKKMQGMVILRNQSIFAHGFGSISKAEFEKFKLFVLELFSRFCELEGIDHDDYCKKICWLNPKESKYYMINQDR